ncbi:hypothetical protein BpHYR1_010031, partial [Brachionus plicatilis]
RNLKEIFEDILEKNLTGRSNVLIKAIGKYETDIERSEVLRMEFLFIPICSCQEHELIIKSRCELSA